MQLPSILSKQTKSGWALLGGAVAALIGFIIFIVTSTSGFMAGRAVNALPIVFSIFAVLGAIALFLFSDKLPSWAVSAILVAVSLLLTVCLCLFIWERVDLAADVYFIPVNYPEAEETALNISIVGCVFYILAIAATAFSGFCERLTKA